MAESAVITHLLWSTLNVIFEFRYYDVIVTSIIFTIILYQKYKITIYSEM